MLAALPIVGATVSRTTTLNVPRVSLPALSRATQVTAVVPNRKRLPLGGVHATDAGAPRSVAVTLKLTVAAPLPSACAYLVDGSVRTGPLLSTTMTSKLPVTVLPAPSLALHVTTVLPIGKTSPDTTAIAGLMPFGRVQTGVTTWLTRSNALTVNVAAAPTVVVASNVSGAVGTVSSGGALSTTRTVNVARDVLPAESVAWQVTDESPGGNQLPDTGAQSTGTVPSSGSVAETA